MKAFGKIKMERHMVRPAIYMAFTRFVLALAAALLAHHFLAGTTPLPVRAYAFTLLFLLFAAFAWIALMRLDGVKLPKMMMKRVHIRKKPARAYGDIADYTDEPPLSFDDLEDDEKDVCCFCADAVCALAFLVMSFL